MVKNIVLFIKDLNIINLEDKSLAWGKKKIRMGSDRRIRNIIKTMLITIVIKKHFYSDAFPKNFPWIVSFNQRLRRA